MTRPINWLLSPLPVLKVSQMVCLLLVIVFFLEGRDQWLLYQFIYLIAFVGVIGNFVLLILYVFDVPLSSKKLPWHQIELLWNVLLSLACAAATAVLAWDWYRLNGGSNRHHSRGPPRTIGAAGWQRRVAMVAGTLLVASILFAVTILRVRRSGLQ